MSDDEHFDGFNLPQENWCKLPFALIDMLPKFSSKAELAVVLYILRHTWGYQEYGDPKPITMDEFVHGRKKRDGTRIDNGVGMSEPSIRNGLREAERHGFINVLIDDTDKARVEKSYMLHMKAAEEKNLPSVSEGERSLPPEVKELTPRGKEPLPRSEKDTLEEILGEEPPAPEEPKFNPHPPRVIATIDPGQLPPHMRAFERVNAGDSHMQKQNRAMEVMLTDVWKAFAAGWKSTQPTCAPSDAEGDMEAIREIQSDIAAGRYTLADVTEYVNWRFTVGRGSTLKMRFLHVDIRPYIEQVKRAKVKGGSPLGNVKLITSDEDAA